MGDFTEHLNIKTMTKEEAINAIYNGNLVECTKEEYQKEIRTALQDKAGKMVDGGDGLRAMMMLEEVRRLDAIHGSDGGF